jgi:hypothetical protein
MSLDGTSALVSDRYLISAVVDTGGTVTAGQVVYISNSGFIPAVLPTSGLSKSVLGVALTSGAAGKTITVICRGLVRVTASGTITTGQRIGSDVNGEVQGIAAMSAPGSDTYTTAAMQPQLDKTEQWIGRALTASSAAGTVIYALIYCIP